MRNLPYPLLLPQAGKLAIERGWAINIGMFAFLVSIISMQLVFLGSVIERRLTSILTCHRNFSCDCIPRRSNSIINLLNK